MKRLQMLILIALLPVALVAGEGMWMPQQIPMLADELRKRGLEIDPNALADLTAHPMGAVVSLGGCSASFVSPQGLVVTNHHCVYGSLQYNSTPERDLINQGFLAATLEHELRAAPGARVYVTTAIEDVTARVTGKISAKLSDQERYRMIERRQNELIRQCESEPGVRCRVASFFEGLQYLQIRQLEIRDVRLVYAPARGIGEFGGEVDNWMWPRHTGDFSFLRAYVGKDGKPADYSPDNVPFQPQHFLKVSAEGINPGDFVMVAGYPGRTYRHRTSDEVAHAQNFFYPTQIRYLQELIRILEAAGKESREIEIRNASRIKGFLNAYKNNQGMLEGLRMGGLVERRRDVETQLLEFIASKPEMAKQYAGVFDRIAELNAEEAATKERDAVMVWMYRASPMFSQAASLYRLAVERRKKDIDRKPRYQERAMPQFLQGLERVQRTIEPSTDRAGLRFLLTEAAALPAEQRIPAVDAALKATGKETVEAQIEAFLDALYAGTRIADLDYRRELVGRAPEALIETGDAMIRFAAAILPTELEIEARDERIDGAMSRLRPQYMAALREMMQGRIYPDANGTLRVTFGEVVGYSPRDAVVFEPQTDVEGIVQKETGEEPFDSPAALLEAIRARRFDGYVDRELGTVPVNFLSTVDTTGGNSGSPTLNAKGELNGLLFDGNYESMSSDYLVVPEVTRSIHVDAVYMLWVMDYVDRAHHLLREMNLPVRSVD